jgi:hypothetical protein
VAPADTGTGAVLMAARCGAPSDEGTVCVLRGEHGDHVDADGHSWVNEALIHSLDRPVTKRGLKDAVDAAVRGARATRHNAQGRSRWDARDVTEANHGGDVMSTQAHASVVGTKAEQRQRIKAYIREVGGATCDEVEVGLGISHQACSARISELRDDGELIEVGQRPTRTGRMARVHRVED